MTTFKIMTWNLENLYRSGTKFGSKTPAEFMQKLNSLAQVILALDPDVLAVQEVGDPAPFADLVATLKGHYPHTQLSTHPDPRGIRVGFLSKLVIKDSEEIVAFPPSGLPSVPKLDQKGNLDTSVHMSRGALRIVVEPKPGLVVHVMTAHLKSKLLTFPNGSHSPTNEDERARVAGIALLQRTAEAVTLRVRTNELLKSNAQDALIILGDLNDVPDAATTQILQGPPGSEIGTTGFDRPDGGDAARLFNLAPLIPQDKRFSRVYKSSGELIDHIFASAKLFPGKPHRLPTVESHIDALGSLPSIDDNPSDRQGKPGSDHAPVTATFEL
jgi:endonuclease/exonuclease/phosphatase family metal-dependent hydrolase